MLCISMAGLALAQTNLVQNYSFEDTSTTVECIYGPTPNPSNIFNHDQEALEDYWAQIPPWTVPEIAINAGAGAGSSDHFCDGGNTGTKYGSTLNREYICAPLITNLVAGHRYLIEFYIKSTSTLTDAGLRFSSDRPTQNGYLRINIDGQPHFEIDNNQVFSYSAWTRVRGYYTPDDDYTWITIGSFDKERDDQSTFAIDDIKIVEWVDYCPAIQLLENWNYDGFIGITINADDKLYAGYDVGAASANGDVIVPNGAYVGFKATNEVGLMDGFGAYYGSEFRAYNAPCNSECLPPDAFAGISQSICDGQPIELGAGAMSGYGYAWTADPAAAITYLSSASVADPVFTPPPGEGDVTYYITVTNTCGQQSTGEVTIHYDDTPSAVAQFSVSNASLGDMPSFDLQLNADIETIYIEVLDAAMNTVYYQELFRNPIDFQCCSMSWALPFSLSPCSDYKIRITATNFCTGATAQQIIDWNRNRTFALTAPIPNVITPNDDGINDQFCVSFTGAVQISLDVKASSGVTVYYTSIPVPPPSACIWNGECNQGLPACVNGPLEDGTYFYILKFFDCAGASYDYTGFITLLNGGNRMQQVAEDTSSQVSGFSLFPNPSSGRFVLSFGGSVEASTVTVYNALGELITTQSITPGSSYVEIDLSGEASGIYYVNYFAGGEMRSERVVIERRE